ncbi:971_t:CDS:2 [Acaulospora colombiana]|uniref:971_t:CDS:1 n=1 Tax=Acaulospora colombiana TaxID=27376 RepID=A0ACA9M355_9GLOM|nr:971_t:CDS:2 [Acaulospora colombiana]
MDGRIDAIHSVQVMAGTKQGADFDLSPEHVHTSYLLKTFQNNTKNTSFDSKGCEKRATFPSTNFTTSPKKLPRQKQLPCSSMEPSSSKKETSKALSRAMPAVLKSTGQQVGCSILVSRITILVNLSYERIQVLTSLKSSSTKQLNVGRRQSKLTLHLLMRTPQVHTLCPHPHGLNWHWSISSKNSSNTCGSLLNKVTRIAASLAPEDGEIAFNLAAVLEACGQLEAALVQYKRSLEFNVERAEQNIRNVSAKIFGQRLKAAGEDQTSPGSGEANNKKVSS